MKKIKPLSINELSKLIGGTTQISNAKGEVFENVPVQSFDRAMQGRLESP